MDLLLEPIEPFIPDWGSPDEWNSAYEKLESYLRAHEVDSHMHRAYLVTVILRRVSQSWKDRPLPAPLSSLAIQEALRMLKEWFTFIMNPPPETDHSFIAAQGRVAFFLCDGPQRWPYVFLADRRIPEEFKIAMHTGLILTDPEIEITSMTPRPIDLGLIPEIADGALDALNRRPLIKSMIGWLIFIAILIYLFRITR